MSFSMYNFIDINFSTHEIMIQSKEGSYVNGVWTLTKPESDPKKYNASVQPLNPKEIQSLEQGGRRLIDAKRAYINNGDEQTVNIFPSSKVCILSSPNDIPSKDDYIYQVIQTDLRPERQYFKLIIARIDK